jgi:hypothetical protein
MPDGARPALYGMNERRREEREQKLEARSQELEYKAEAALTDSILFYSVSCLLAPDFCSPSSLLPSLVRLSRAVRGIVRASGGGSRFEISAGFSGCE